MPLADECDDKILRGFFCRELVACAAGVEAGDRIFRIKGVRRGAWMYRVKF